MHNPNNDSHLSINIRNSFSPNRFWEPSIDSHGLLSEEDYKKIFTDITHHPYSEIFRIPYVNVISTISEQTNFWQLFDELQKHSFGQKIYPNHDFYINFFHSILSSFGKILSKEDLLKLATLISKFSKSHIDSDYRKVAIYINIANCFELLDLKKLALDNYKNSLRVLSKSHIKDDKYHFALGYSNMRIYFLTMNKKYKLSSINSFKMIPATSTFFRQANCNIHHLKN